MKDTFIVASLVAIVTAIGPRPSSTAGKLIYFPRYYGDYGSLSYSPVPPTSTDSSLIPSSVIVIPVPASSSCLDVQPSKTVVITITSTHTIAVSHVPSSLNSETATSALGTVTAPQESAPVTEPEESSIKPPEETPAETATGVTAGQPYIPTDIATATETEVIPTTLPDLPITATDIEESSVPSASATDEPTETTAIGTGSYTAAPTLPDFTAAADAIRAPAIVAGFLGWVVLIM